MHQKLSDKNLCSQQAKLNVRSGAYSRRIGATWHMAALAEKRNHGSARILTLTYKLSEPVAQNGNNDIKARRIELVFLNECVPLGDLLGIRRKLL